MQYIKNLIMRVATEDHCPLYLHWPCGFNPNAGTPLRQWASRCRGRGRWSWLRWLFMLLLTVTWPFRLLRLIRHTTRAFAPSITNRTGKLIWRQVAEQLWLGLCHALPPEAYYTYELYRAERRGLVDHYLHQYEASALLPYLNRDHRHPAIDDKAQFARLCQQHQLPTATTLGSCEQGRCNWQATARVDIFIKPLCGARGEGTMLWRQLADNQYQDHNGHVQTRNTLIEQFEKLSLQQAYLVQARLYNHPAIAALSPGALSTARIVTGRTPTGAIETVAATFKMAWQPSIINTHGLNSAIELTTGQLARAYSYDPICSGYDAHPVTGALITGAILPDWPDALALAERVHQQFPGYVFLGWDVAPTPQGPVLLEGNAGWDVVTVQKPQGIPLAQTRFADICRLWMEGQRRGLKWC